MINSLEIRDLRKDVIVVRKILRRIENRKN